MPIYSDFQIQCCCIFLKSHHIVFEYCSAVLHYIKWNTISSRTYICHSFQMWETGIWTSQIVSVSRWGACKEQGCTLQNWSIIHAKPCRKSIKNPETEFLAASFNVRKKAIPSQKLGFSSPLTLLKTASLHWNMQYTLLSGGLLARLSEDFWNLI